MTRIILAIESCNRTAVGAENYLAQTLKNLTRSGLRSPHLAGVVISVGSDDDSYVPSGWTYVKGACTRQQNAARALQLGAAYDDADWVVKLEDDLDFCDDFVGSVARWLDRHGAQNVPLFALGATLENVSRSRFGEDETLSHDGPSFPSVRALMKRGAEFVPRAAGGFWGAQAIALKRDVARELVAWMGEDPAYDDGREKHRNRGHDLLLAKWMLDRRSRSYGVAIPSFVQHLGRASTLSNPAIGHVQPYFEFPWLGREWRYGDEGWGYQAKTASPARRPRLLWVGDAACDSGFAKATHKTLETLVRDYDVTVLGINHRGDPDHGYPYPIFPAARFGAGDDAFGVRRVLQVAQKCEPDVVVIQQDPWNFPGYVKQLEQLPARPVLVGAVAVDGLNCRGDLLNGLDYAVFWTRFGQEEAIKGGYNGPSSVIPLGVDRTIYSPGNRQEARRALGLPEVLKDHWIVGNVNRNQHRKRADLLVRYFGIWARDHKVDNACLFLHVAPTGDYGYDVEQLAKYYGVKLVLAEPSPYAGATEQHVRDTYRALNVNATCTQGEGFGLTTLESMACGIVTVAPDFSGLASWAGPAAALVPCTSFAATLMRGIGVVGGIADEAMFIHALQRLYEVPELYADHVSRSLDLAAQPQFDWANIGERWLEALACARTGEPVKEAACV